MTPQEFREQHAEGDYTAWSDETYDLYFALIAHNAQALTQKLTEPAPSAAPAA